MLAATTELPDGGAVFNVGSGQQTSLKDVVDVACRVLEIKSEPQWGSMPNRKWDTSVWVANNDKIKKELGWQLNDDFERGFIKMVDWLKRDASMRKFYESKIESTVKA